MSHTQDDGNVERHDHDDPWDDGDVSARKHLEREKAGDRRIAERLGRTIAAVRSRRYRERRKA